jgi:hypothetical protein
MSNIGIRFVIELRDDDRYWFSFTDRGELHQGGKGYSSLEEAAQEAALHHRLVKFARHRAREKERRAADNQ